MKQTGCWDCPTASGVKKSPELPSPSSPFQLTTVYVMATSGENVNRSVAQRLEQKRRYEVRCTIRQHDEQAQNVREDEYLKTFVKEYETLRCIQVSMR